MEKRTTDLQIIDMCLASGSVATCRAGICWPEPVKNYRLRPRLRLNFFLYQVSTTFFTFYISIQIGSHEIGLGYFNQISFKSLNLAVLVLYNCWATPFPPNLNSLGNFFNSHGSLHKIAELQTWEFLILTYHLLHWYFSSSPRYSFHLLRLYFSSSPVMLFSSSKVVLTYCIIFSSSKLDW